MTRPQSSPILAQLRGAKSFPEQTAALQALKNEIVGHVQKKEEWVSVGVLEPIVRSLASTRTPLKMNGKDIQQPSTMRPLSEEDEVKLQALQLVSSFANGGPAFLPPLDAAMALPAILNNISPASTPTQIIAAALKALTSIADAALLASPSCNFNVEAIADHVFIPQHIESLSVILASSSAPGMSLPAFRQNTLAIGIICRLCREERHQHALAAGGVLDLLATQLASVAVRDGFVVPGAEESANKDTISGAFPVAARKNAKIGLILEALSTIIGDSKYRATRLVNSPSILAVFPSIEARHFPQLGVSKSQDSENMGPELFRPKWLTAMEYLLPAVVIPQTRSGTSTPFAHSDYVESKTSRKGKSGLAFTEAARFHVPGHNGSYPTSDVESPIIPWLVYLVRSLDEVERLAALSVLASLFRAGLCMTIARETTLALLVVPILINAIQKNDKESKEGKEVEEIDDIKTLTRHYVLERAPVILARLITDCELLQKAAFDCDAVKVLTKLLKNTYRPLPLIQPQYWSAHPDEGMDVEGQSPMYRLGDTGAHPVMAHRIRTREAALKAIGAIAACNEDYRKALVLEDFVPYVVESLSEFPGKPRQPKDRKEKNAIEPPRTTANPDYGTNTIGVIVAACFVARMLSRSVHTSRTALIDHNIAAPILNAMKHSDINLQIAATATVANLVVSVSPSKEYLTEHGVMKVLCEHAHSSNPALRLNALWALKHFVDGVSASMKKTCLEQLEPGWLVQLLGDDDQGENMYTSRGDDLDEEMDGEHPDVPSRWLYASGGSICVVDASESSKLRQIEDYLSSIRDSECNPIPRARNDVVAVQEQGVDFIRNLIGRVDGGAGADTSTENPEVIDYLFQSLGQERLFDILASKLRAKVLHPFTRKGSAAGRETKIVHPQARIVAVVIYILTHVAATGPRYCQLVISQTELLKLLVQQASSKDCEVRLALCRLLYNLTTKDNGAESQACAQRAAELKRLGFSTKIEILMKGDRDLNVRENARMAAWLIENPAT